MVMPIIYPKPKMYCLFTIIEKYLTGHAQLSPPDPEMYRMLFISSFSVVRLTLVLIFCVEPRLLLIHSFPKSFDGFLCLLTDFLRSEFTI